jgi:hypothetical protein
MSDWSTTAQSKRAWPYHRDDQGEVGGIKPPAELSDAGNGSARLRRGRRRRRTGETGSNSIPGCFPINFRGGYANNWIVIDNCDPNRGAKCKYSDHDQSPRSIPSPGRGVWERRARGSLERGGTSPEGASDPRARQSLGGTAAYPSSEPGFRPRGAWADRLECDLWFVRLFVFRCLRKKIGFPFGCLGDHYGCPRHMGTVYLEIL